MNNENQVLAFRLIEALKQIRDVSEEEQATIFTQVADATQTTIAGFELLAETLEDGIEIETRDNKLATKINKLASRKIASIPKTSMKLADEVKTMPNYSNDNLAGGNNLNNDIENLFD